MKLSIKSSEKIEKFYLKNVSEKNYHIELEKEQNIPEGWYELIIPYMGKKIEINDILVNNSSLKENLYIGFYTDGKGKIHQPASSVWDEGGYFTIWIHTQPGRIWQRFTDQIRQGDLGTNLFDKYLFTIDRPFEVANYFDNTIKDYFMASDGPNWWLKKDRFTPYVEIDSINKKNTDINQLLLELKKIFPKVNESLIKGHRRQGLKEGLADLPFIEIETIQSQFIQNFIKKIGYKKIIDIQLQTLDPNTSIKVHKDHHYDRKCYPYTSGAVKFYWNLTDSKDVYFKLGNAGLLPLDKPLFINATEHVHAVVNQTNNKRIVLTMYGEL